MKPHPIWRSRGFRGLWASVGVSLAGTHVSVIALPLTALGALDATAGQVALLAAAATAPFLILGLPAGAWVDRLPLRPLMIRCDVVRFLLLLSVPVAYALDVLGLAQLYVVAFATGAAGVLFDVAALSVLPSVVQREHLAVANGRLEAVRATAQTSGPALGGSLVQLLTAPVAVLADALSYLLSAVLLRGLPPLPPPPGADRSEGLLRQVGAGLRYCLTHRHIRPLALSAAWANLCTEALLAVFVTHAVRDLHLAAVTVGLVLALSNLGYLAGSLVTPWLNDRLGVGRTIVLSALLHGGFVLVALAPETATWAWLTAGLALTAAGGGIWNVDAVTLRQAGTPPEMLARMNATNRFLIWGTMPLGAAAGALLAEVWDLRTAVTVAALALPCCALPVLFSAVRRLKTMPLRPDPEPGPGPAPSPGGEPAPAAVRPA
ncbi:MFS transporter [Streptomyces sp. NPDC101118]|uniref:MFS transporter n=1 Tax=Streptomyces sp. NPDC101118 TaxID=3366109 RepID=UPI00382A4C1C